MPKFGLTFLAIALAILPSLVLAQDSPSSPPPISGPKIDNPDEDTQKPTIIDSGGNLKAIESSDNPVSTQTQVDTPVKPGQPAQVGKGAELPQPTQTIQKNLPNLPPGPPQGPASQQPQTYTPPPDATSTSPMGR